MKKSLTVYTIIIYLMQFCFVLGFIALFSHDIIPEDMRYPLTQVFFIIGLIIFFFAIISGIASIIFTVKDTLLEHSDFTMPMVFKLIHIPYFLINFVLWTILFIASLNPFLIVGGFIMIPIAIGITYMTMMPTSLCIVAMMVNKIMRGEETLKNTWYYIVMCFIFCLDVFSSILLFFKYRNQQQPDHIS